MQSLQPGMEALRLHGLVAAAVMPASASRHPAGLGKLVMPRALAQAFVPFSEPARLPAAADATGLRPLVAG